MSELSTIVSFLKQTNELKVAYALLSTFEKYATILEQMDEVANGYCEIKYYKEAIALSEKCLAIASNPEQLYSIRANLAKLYNHYNEPNKALLYLKANNEVIPNQYENLLEQVFALFLLNRKEESEAVLREMVTRDDLPEEIMNRILFNLGTYDLYRGRLQQGLTGFLITGKKLGIWKSLELPFKFWSGGIIPGMTLVIATEGGIGDEFIPKLILLF